VVRVYAEAGLKSQADGALTAPFVMFN
jgi:hypothetical protein